jgi:hypothetical protein
LENHRQSRPWNASSAALFGRAPQAGNYGRLALATRKPRVQIPLGHGV